MKTGASALGYFGILLAWTPVPHLLTIADLHAGYGKIDVLRGVSLTLNAGEIVALIGPNGCGKTTLLKAALGQLPFTGAADWDGRDVRRWAPRQLARRVAYLPQSPTVEPGRRVDEVLRLGRSPYLGAFGVESKRDGEVVEAVAERLALTDLLHRPINALSGGQRQRVFLGRCLVQEPAAVLLDEPDTYLDLRHQADLAAMLRRLADDEGLGVLMASHDLNLAASVADRLVLLHGGKVAASGPPDAVLTPAVLEPAYGVRVGLAQTPAGRPVVFPIS